MKFIPENYITGVSSNLQDPIYIDDWILEDDKPKKVWKSTGASGMLALAVQGHSNCITLYNHNANRITITIKDVTGVTTLDGPYVIDLSTYSYGNDCVWQEYDAQSVTHKVIVNIALARTTPVYCGVAWAGKMKEYNNPDKGFTLGYEDYSLEYNMSSGSIRRTEKDFKRKFSLTSTQSFSDYLDIHRDIKNTIGNRTIPWLIQDDQYTTHNILGYINDFGLGSHSKALYSKLPLEIIER